MYDRFRLDHVVGYFRMYVRKPGHRGHFDPEGDATQRTHGERVLRAIIDEAGRGNGGMADVRRSSPRTSASSRPSSARHSASSDTRIQGHPVGEGRRAARRDVPRSFGVLPPERRDLEHARHRAHHGVVGRFPRGSRGSSSRRLAGISKKASEDERVFALLGLLFRAGSSLTLTLAQELLGERTRINTPGTVGEANWTYRLPKPIEDLEIDERVKARLDRVRALAGDAGRARDSSPKLIRWKALGARDPIPAAITRSVPRFTRPAPTLPCSPRTRRESSCASSMTRGTRERIGTIRGHAHVWNAQRRGGRARPALRLPRARAVRSGAGPPLQPEQATRRSVRARAVREDRLSGAGVRRTHPRSRGRWRATSSGTFATTPSGVPRSIVVDRRSTGTGTSGRRSRGRIPSSTSFT